MPIRRNSSLKTEIEKLRAEIAELVEARKPPSRWIEVICPIGESRDEEIAAILADGNNVIIHQITRPAPRVMDDDELTPELRVIGERARLEREVEASASL